jgi:hypothetical protein
MLFDKQKHVHNSSSQMQCIRHQTLKNYKEEKTDKPAKKKIKPNPLQSVGIKISPEIITVQMQLARVLELCLLDYLLACFILSTKYYWCSWFDATPG